MPTTRVSPDGELPGPPSSDVTRNSTTASTRTSAADDRISDRDIEIAPKSNRNARGIKSESTEEELERDIVEEFGGGENVFRGCTMKDCIATCLEAPDATGNFSGADYSAGDWVEVQGLDSQWTLCRIKRVIKQAPDTFDASDPDNYGIEPNWEYSYNAGPYRLIKEKGIRAPAAGLKKIFGSRPFVWQQWALLKYEDLVRFQLNHDDDFAQIDAKEFATILWDEWVNDPRNIEFKALLVAVNDASDAMNAQVEGYHGDADEKSVPEHELKEHLFCPFVEIDDVTEDVKHWDFDDVSDLSVYTYFGVLGNGAVIPLVCLAMQFLIPILLLETSARSGNRGITTTGTSIMTSLLDTCNSAEWSRAPKDEEEGGSMNSLYGKTMVLLVVLFYFFKVVPDTAVSFYNTAGTADTTYSRIMSIRRVIWEKGRDNVGQMMGFKMDLYMNTAFECMLYTLNLFIIYNTTNVLDIILNALAIEFVHQLDEAFAQTGWWDKNRRFLKAGVCEMILMKTVETNVLVDVKRMATRFDMDKDKVLSACDRDYDGVSNKDLAFKDQNNLKYMRPSQAYDHRASAIALKRGIKAAYEEYEKPTVYWGWDAAIRAKISGDVSGSMFNKLEYHRCWSRWERLLFLSKVPKLADHMDDKANQEQLSTIQNPFENHKLAFSSNPVVYFVQEVVGSIFLVNLLPEVGLMLVYEKYFAALFRLVNAFVCSLMYSFQVVFPFVILASIYYLPMCY